MGPNNNPDNPFLRIMVNDDSQAVGQASVHTEESEATPLLSSRVVQPLSKAQRRVARAQLIALCWCLFVVGWSDASTGPLLPRIRKVFDVDYQTVSWVFVMGRAGTVLGGLANIPLGDRVDFGKILSIGSVLYSCASIVQTYAPSFTTFVLSAFVGSFGRTLQAIHANAFIALVKHDGESKMAFIQAFYGFGALIGPLAATQFSQMTFWRLHYLVSFTLSVSNLLAVIYVFRFKGQDDCLRESGEVIPSQTQSPSENGNKYSVILQSKAVNLLALFLLLFIGVGSTIGGWTVTFMIDERNCGHNCGYISVVFYAGLTLGRIILIPVNQKFGEVNVIFPYTALATLFQIFVWFIPSILLDSIAVFFIGMVLGPMFPIVMRHTTKVVPRSLVPGSIGWISACSGVGSAVLPFMTGWMAQRWGLISLQPFLVVMMFIMGLVWLIVPKKSVLLEDDNRDTVPEA